MEVIVVDNNSSDGTSEFLATNFPQIKVIRNLSNEGYAPAMNLALAAARGRYVLTLSHDAELKAGAAQALINFMDSHPRAGLAGPLTLDGEGKVMTTLHSPNFFLSVWGEIMPIKQFMRQMPRLRRVASLFLSNRTGLTSNYGLTRQVPLVDGGCIMTRRELLDQVGCLDPYMPLGPDDRDWCHRARQQGFEVWFVAESEIIHRAKPRENMALMDPYLCSILTPQMCYFFSKYHKGFKAQVFYWSAYLLNWKRSLQSRKFRGFSRDHAAAFKIAADLCLRPEKYIAEYKKLWNR